MPALTVRARSLPHPPDLPTSKRICRRCGITFNYKPGRDNHITHCRDCRGCS